LLPEDLISCVPIFSLLPAQDLERIAQSARSAKVSEHALIFREGHKDENFYILLEGQVEVIKALGTVDERLLAIREPCSLLGELSLFSEDGSHTASVRALTDLQLLEVNRGEINDLLHREPKVAYELIRTISQRLVESEDLTIGDLRKKNKELQEAYQELSAAQAQIIEIEKYKKELEVARQIQMSMLPRKMLNIPNFSYSARIEPMQAVGGDFYDVIPLDNHLFAILIGDVSDHGVPAALFMSLTTTLTRAEAGAGLPPELVLRKVNQHLLGMNDAGMFVTLLYGLLDTNQKTFSYCRAGHEFPLIISAEGEEIPCFHKRGQPLGLFTDPVLDQSEIVINSGSSMVLYTDGITNTVDSEQAQFGLIRLAESLRNSRNKPAQSFVDELWKEIKVFRGSTDQEDDLTLLVVKAD
jgi:sigma-B regulation protein RsbU (phosphoserine phosphatase)